MQALSGRDSGARVIAIGKWTVARTVLVRSRFERITEDQLPRDFDCTTPSNTGSPRSPVHVLFSFWLFYPRYQFPAMIMNHTT